MLWKRVVYGVAFALGAGIVAALASYFLVMAFSPNLHDRALEASMTSVFLFGPIGAVAGFVVGLGVGGRRPSPASPDLEAR